MERQELVNGVVMHVWRLVSVCVSVSIFLNVHACVCMPACVCVGVLRCLCRHDDDEVAAPALQLS